MAQQVVHARVLFKSLNPFTDDSSNDFYFEATGAGSTIDFDAVLNPTTVITSFYNAKATAAPDAVCFWLSHDLDQSVNGTIIEYYDVTNHLDGTPAGSPIRQDTFTLGPTTGGGNLPPGCAATIGYRASYGGSPEFSGGTRPRARKRGRIYVGPLVTATTNGQGGQFVTSFVNSLAQNFSVAATTKNQGETNQFNMVQWSRRDQAVHSIADYFVDEGVTYQRRRGDDTMGRVHTWVPVGS